MSIFEMFGGASIFEEIKNEDENNKAVGKPPLASPNENLLKGFKSVFFFYHYWEYFIKISLRYRNCVKSFSD